MAGSTPGSQSGAGRQEAPRRVGSSRPTANAIRATNLLDKIRILRYSFPLSESLSRAPKVGGMLWLFESCNHNLLREPEAEERFSSFIARNPLKRLDSKK